MENNAVLQFYNLTNHVTGGGTQVQHQLQALDTLEVMNKQ